MSRTLLTLFIFLFVILSCTYAQESDSIAKPVTKHVNLNEVVVNGMPGNDDAQGNYYKQNKLPTTEEILSRIAGVSLIRRGDYGMEPVLRTYSGGEINLTINGMKIFGACTDKMDPATIYIEPNNLSKITISQGASGSEYGSTVGGSMNMDLKEAQCTPEKSVYFTTGSSYSSVNNGYNGNLALSISGPKMALRISGVYRKAFDYREGGGAIVPYSGYEKTNFMVSTAFKLRPQHTLNVDYIGDLGWNIGYPALPMDAGRARANIASVSHGFDGKGKVLKRVDTKVYFNHVYHAMDDTHRPETTMHMDMPGWSYTFGLYSDVKLAAGKNNVVEIKGDYYTNHSKADMTMYPLNSAVMHMMTLPENMRHFVGLYLGDEWIVKPHHILKFNVRSEVMHAKLLSNQGRQQWSIFTDTTTVTKVLPSASIRYTLLCPHNVSVNLTTAYGTSAPTANQLYGYYLFTVLDNYDYIGNPSLKAEKSVQAEANISYGGKVVQLSATAFYHQLYDFIIGEIVGSYQPLTEGAYGIKRFSNIAGAYITGVDASASINLKRGFQSMNTLTYSYGSLSDGSPVPMLSPLRGISSVRYTIKGWHIQAETEWASAKDRINNEVGETTTTAYALLNLRTGYKLTLKQHVISINLSVENVLDKKYRQYSDWGNVFRPGRNFLVYVSYSFGK